MAYLFSVNKKGTVLFHPDAMNLCPEFSLLDDKEKLALVLIVDYDSPYNQLPEQERKHKAAVHVYGDVGKSSHFDKKLFQNAIELYKSLQFSTNKELIKTYKEKLDSLSMDLMKASSPMAIKNIMDSQEKIRKSVMALEQEMINQQEMDYVLKGGGKLSFMEQLIANREAYNRVVAKR